jgi:hypothetical protein
VIGGIYFAGSCFAGGMGVALPPPVVVFTVYLAQPIKASGPLIHAE